MLVMLTLVVISPPRGKLLQLRNSNPPQGLLLLTSTNGSSYRYYLVLVITEASTSALM